MISEQEIFAPGDCLAQMIRALALGNTYRSPQLKACMVRPEAGACERLDAVMSPPYLT